VPFGFFINPLLALLIVLCWLLLLLRVIQIHTEPHNRVHTHNSTTPPPLLFFLLFMSLSPRVCVCVIVIIIIFF
jgi:hypothetical protein